MARFFNRTRGHAVIPVCLSARGRSRTPDRCKGGGVLEYGTL